MKISFEIYTTDAIKPIILSFDKNMLMPHFYESLINEIEYNTTLIKENIIDIFTEHSTSNNVLSFSNYTNKMSLEQFITLNRNFFPFMPITKNYYKIFVLDKMYMAKKNSIGDTPSDEDLEIKTNPWDDFKELLTQTKKLIYLL